MSADDWRKRGHEQAAAMINGLTADYANPDEQGNPTSGCYNGDYPDSYHDKCNQQLEEDEYYEAQIESDLNEIIGRQR